MTRVLALSSLLALAAACGGAQTQPATSAEPAAEVEASAPSAPVADKWTADLTIEQKADFMKAKVTPHMAGVFQAFDATRYAEFGCQTCHGPEGKAPQEFLPRLTVKDGQLAGLEGKEAITKFMMEKVTPEMVATLGVAPMDPATHQGFGCNGCHGIDMK